MSLLWIIWTHWNEFCKTSYEDKRYYQKMFNLYRTWSSCQELMNIGRIEDEKKAKNDNIRKQMRQQWVPKSTKNASPENDEKVTQELGDSTFYT